MLLLNFVGWKYPGEEKECKKYVHYEKNYLEKIK